MLYMSLGKNIPELSRENLIFSLSISGFVLDAEILSAYDLLIQKIVDQVYTIKRDANKRAAKKKDQIHLSLEKAREELAARGKSFPHPVPMIERMCSHIDEMLLIHNGRGRDGYFENISKLGKADATELSLCQKFLEVMEADPNWNDVAEFLIKLIHNIKNEFKGSSISASKPAHINTIENQKLFKYGNEFKNFICPNPFIYLELRQGGEVSSCCYLNFSTGNISEQEFGNVWNSDISQELRRSILTGEYCYCDKNKCAAMQEALLPQKKDLYKYQIPYQLIPKEAVQNKIIQNCISTGRVDNIATPEIISFEDDPSCNLSCPSCRTSIISLKGEDSKRNSDYQFRLLDSLGASLKELWLCGAGDVFAAASYRKLLQNYNFTKFPDLGIRIDTNGILFNENSWGTTLKEVQKTIKLVAISVDASTSDAYEVIRRGGKFKTILKNLKFISTLPERESGMGFIIRMIVQKKNFREIEAVCRVRKRAGC